MAKALSIDLRSRVVAAIGSGMSCRQAGVRFGVSASSAIRWRQMERSQGDPQPKQQGGDRRSERIEKHAERILALAQATPDMTLMEIRTYLPPYSPDFNPIENAFAKLKAMLRKAAQRNIHALWDTIGNLIPSFTPAECTNYFTAEGYEPD